MRLQRSAGILLHPTSLPGGRLGDEAFAFVDWLQAAGQSWWQILPLGPPDEAGSPYRSASAFAGWTALLADPNAEVTREEVESFVRRHPFWTGDWAAFDGCDDAIAGQVRFEREWGELRAYARDRGIRLIGDIPIYVSDGGADHTAHPELFQKGVQAGVPPDLFSRTGQLWGNPIYDWAAMRATGWRWWIERFRRTFELVDITRLDHFRAFVAYWAVPVHHRTAKIGRWRRGPGRELFDAARAELGDLPLIAEDLGVITPPVEQLRDGLGLPGMHVLQFAFDGSQANPHRPENHRENAFVYTGTHDNDTALGWWASLRRRGRERTGLGADEPHWALIRLAYASRSRVAVVPMQDVLGLGSDARMNTPGRAQGNWSWRLREGELTRALAEQLRDAAVAAERAAAATV